MPHTQSYQTLPALKGLTSCHISLSSCDLTGRVGAFWFDHVTLLEGEGHFGLII